MHPRDCACEDCIRREIPVFSPEHPHIPDYYRPVRGFPRKHGELFDAIDLIQMFDLGFERGCAIKYLIRAGRKPGTPELKDLYKAMEFIQRAINMVKQDGTT